MHSEIESINTACLMCHAPIVLPEIARREKERVAASTAAMQECAALVVARRPDILVVISPHTPRSRNAFVLLTDDLQGDLHGDFASFGFPGIQIRLPGHKQAVQEISDSARVPCRPFRRELDHGAMVPLYFLQKSGWTGPTIVIGFPAENSLRHCSELGRTLAKVAAGRNENWALIASGDMSHRLQPDAHAGYNPLAALFDRAVVDAIRANDLNGALAVDASLRELAAEDVIDSLAVASGAFNGMLGGRVLSYEAPFGVGYLIAMLRDGVSP